MAAVSLETVLLAAVSDPSTTLSLDVNSRSETDSLVGQVRAYAGGRQRSVARAGARRTVPIKFDVIANRPLLATLRSWKGVPVLYRDPRGRKLYAVFFDLTIEEHIAVEIAKVSLTLSEITITEVV